MYRFRLCREMVLIRLTGPFDLERSIETLDRLESVRRDHPSISLVWDARRRTDYPSPQDLRWLVPYFMKWRRVAIVAGPPMQYSIARLASLMSRDHAHACHDLHEAMRWIRGETPQ